MNLKIKQITYKELEISIEFLRVGFNWSKYKAKKVKDFLKISNNDKLFYGYLLIDSNEKICGAILTIFQGSIKKLNGENKDIMNLSAWYVSPSKRGIPSIFFAQSFIRDLLNSNYLITDYTPTQVAIKIFNQLGLIEMNLTQRYYAIWSSPKSFLKNFVIFLKEPSLFKSIKKVDKKFNIFQKYNLKNILFFTVRIGYEESSFAVVKKIIKTKRIGINFYFPVLQILWVEKEEFFLNNWNFIRTLIHLKFLVFYIFVTFRSTQTSDDVNYSQRIFLIDKKSKKEFDQCIYPIGSELCIK